MVTFLGAAPKEQGAQASGSKKADTSARSRAKPLQSDGVKAPAGGESNPPVPRHATAPAGAGRKLRSDPGYT